MARGVVSPMMVMSVMVLVMRGRRNARICKNQKCHRDADYLSHDSIPFLLLEFAPVKCLPDGASSGAPSIAFGGGRGE